MNKFTVYYQNVRGLRSKTTDLYLEVLNNTYDIIVLVETWLTDSIYDSEIIDDRYQVFRRDRASAPLVKKHKGGGVLIAVSNKYQAARKKEWESEVEDLWVTIKLDTDTGPNEINLCAVYIAPPPKLLETYLHKLDQVCANDDGSDFVVIGDFNIPELRWQSGGTNKPSNVSPLSSIAQLLLHHVHFNNFLQFNTIKNLKGNILDLVFSNLTSLAVTEADQPLSKLDNYHPALIVTIHFEIRQPLRESIKLFRNFNAADYSKINRLLRDTDWNTTINFNSGNVGTVVKIFYDTLLNIISEHVPSRKNKNRKYPVWYSTSLIKLITEKYKHHKKWKKYGNPMDKLTFELLRSRSKILIKKCYKKYINDVEGNIIKDPKTFWSFSKHLRKNKNCIPSQMRYLENVSSDGSGIANLFAAHFSSVYTKETPGDSQNINVLGKYPR